MNSGQRFSSLKRMKDNNNVVRKNDLVIRELSNDTRWDFPVKHSMSEYRNEFSLHKQLEMLQQAQHGQKITSDQKFHKLKELTKENSKNIENLMDFLDVQKKEYKEYKSKENRQIQKIKTHEDFMVRKNMSDGMPKHPRHFIQRIHKQDLLQEPLFMPIEDLSHNSKLKSEVEILKQAQTAKLMGKPWNYITKHSNRFNLNKYDKEFYLLQRQTMVGQIEKPEREQTDPNYKWEYFYKNRKGVFDLNEPEFIDPKVKDFHYENMKWIPTKRNYGYYFDPKQWS